MVEMSKVLNEAAMHTASLEKKTPEQMKAMQGLLDEAFKDGALPKKYKSLIAMSIGITSACSWCIALHVKKALDAGASEEEVKEAIWAAIAMGGGPALMYAQLAFKALEEFKH